MVSQSPIRSDLHGKRVLLIDHCQATREARAAVLRSHGVEVHEAEEISAARFLWQPHVYDLVMLDARRYSSRILRADQGCKSQAANRFPHRAPKVPLAYMVR